MSSLARRLLARDRVRPILSLPFAGGSNYFPDLITFTRASAGYYENSDGTLTSFASGAARIGDRGLLIEGARTNLLLRSQEFDNAAWTDGSTGVNVSADAATAPDDTETADVFLAENANVFFRNSASITVSAEANHVFSFYAKDVNGTVKYRGFDVSNGAEITSAAYTAGSAWERQTIPFTTPADCTAVYVYPFFQTTDGATATLWEAQLEEASFASTPITTEGSTVTRAADVATYTPPANLAGMVIAARTAPGIGSDAQVLWQADDGTENERFRIERNTSNEIHFIVTDGGTDVADLNLGTVAHDTRFKVAVSFETNDVRGCLDGGTVVSDTSATMPTVDTARLGRDTAGEEWFGYIERIDAYRRLESSQLQAYST